MKCCFNILSLSQEVTEDSRTEALQAELAAKEAEIQKLKEQLRVSIIDRSLRRNSSTQVWHMFYYCHSPVTLDDSLESAYDKYNPCQKTKIVIWSDFTLNVLKKHFSICTKHTAEWPCPWNGHLYIYTWAEFSVY